MLIPFFIIPPLDWMFWGWLKAFVQYSFYPTGRLEEVAKILEIKPTGKKCVGMEGVIGEGSEALEEEGEDAVFDLGLIGAGSRVEHYEMAGYLTAISLAERMDAKGIVKLLQQTLAEEEAAETKLRKIASTLLKSVTPE